MSDAERLLAQSIAELHARNAEMEAEAVDRQTEIACLKAEIDALRTLLLAVDTMKKRRLGEPHSKRLRRGRLTLVPRE